MNRLALSVAACVRPHSFSWSARGLISNSGSSSAEPLGLAYDREGEAAEVLELRPLPPLPPASHLLANHVAVKFLLAPINPSDLNTIQGKYPLRPPLPNATPGHEGVAHVVATGSEVSSLVVGDRVVPARPSMGTWRTHGVFAADAFTRVPSDLPPQQAAMLSINPPTAVGLLERFVDLQPGDVVVQNGGTSAVGQAVTQLGRHKGLRVVSVIRARPPEDFAAAHSHLMSLGAALVTTAEELPAALRGSSLTAPRLALNCEGGAAALAVTKVLQPGGVMVTYGNMSMQPVSLPASLLIFKDITFRGFWCSGKWSSELGTAGREAMLQRCAEYMRNGVFTLQAKEFPVALYRDALQEVARAHRGHKVLLRF